jgi:hypothetical protein
VEKVRGPVERIGDEDQPAPVGHCRRQFLAEDPRVGVSCEDDFGDGMLGVAIDVAHEIRMLLRFPLDGEAIGSAFANDLGGARGGGDAGRQ